MSSQSMRGLVFDARAPALVRLRDDLSPPSAGRGEVCVRVTHSTVNGHEFELARHPMFRVLSFLKGARGPVRTGLEFAGVVATDGETVRTGDRVMGYVDLLAGHRPHADYVTIPEPYLGPVPAGVSLAQASTLPMSGLTALAALRDVAGVEAGQHVLVIGAAGGVGVLAVQIARILGASATAMATQAHHARLQALGATRTIDHRRTPIADLEGSFDAILDFSDTLRLRDVGHLLTRQGTFVPADPVANLPSIVTSSRVGYLMVDRGDASRLAELAAWVEAGRLQPVVDQSFPLDHWQQAVSHSHTRGRMGRTVLCFEPC
ncbi:MAG: NADP-dependent oxidoreductase [Myxococcales bacterium]|nr:NADP-dependent oxidoreductase [Myxococcales bacterium]